MKPSLDFLKIGVIWCFRVYMYGNKSQMSWKPNSRTFIALAPCVPVSCNRRRTLLLASGWCLAKLQCSLVRGKGGYAQNHLGYVNLLKHFRKQGLVWGLRDQNCCFVKTGQQPIILVYQANAGGGKQLRRCTIFWCHYFRQHELAEW